MVTGMIVDGIGVGLLVAGLLADRAVLIVAGAVVSGAGLFIIFEGAKGWCVLRALGVKTRL